MRIGNGKSACVNRSQKLLDPRSRANRMSAERILTSGFADEPPRSTGQHQGVLGSNRVVFGAIGNITRQRISFRHDDPALKLL